MSTDRPLFSVITPVYEPPVSVLRDMIDSVRHQRFGDWELVLVDDVSPSDEVRDVLREAAQTDRRITVVERATNGGIVAASNDAVDRARGEFLVLVDHDDLLTADALEVMARAIEADPNADYLYSDEDKVDADGRFYDLFRKPDWSPERLRGQMYTGHLSVMRTALVRQVGAFRAGFDGSQDHDLALRVSERAAAVVHVPEVLYHWRVVPGSAAGDPNAKPYAWVAGRNAVADHLERAGIDGTADYGPFPGYYRVRRRLDPDMLVSVIIPTRGSTGLVWGQRRCFVVEAVRSALARTDHRNVEIVVVYDTPTPPEVLAELRDVADDRLVLVHYTEPFNFSAKCNVGFLAAHGEAIVLLNDDMEVVSDGWLEQLVAPLAEPGVGMTGAHLLYSDGTMQHAGLVFRRNHYGHAFLGALENDSAEFGAMLVNREASGLTAACVALPRAVYEQVGGLCEELPGSFNDVDLSFKVRHAGYRLVWLVDVKLYHFESRTRDKTVRDWEHHFVMDRWTTPDKDPYLPTLAPPG